MSSLYQLEREVCKEDAFKTIEQEVKKMHLSFDYLLKEQGVAHLELYNKQGQCISAGSGKGDNSEVGALAEALEHFGLEKSDNHTNKRVSFSKIKSQPQLKADRLLQSVNDSAYVEVTPFIDHQYHSVVDLPISYINPFFESHHNPVDSVLSRYSTNLGTSFGISYNESYLHALNEAVERHYTSLLYMSHIGFQTGVKWQDYRFDRTFHYEKRQKLRQKHGDVYTVVTQTHFGVYVAISVLQHSKSVKLVMAQIGAGASISADLAITRSLDELWQCIELYSEEEYFEDLFARDQLLEFSKLAPLIGMQKLENVDAFRVVNGAEMSVKEQVDTIENNLIANGYRPLSRTLMRSGNIHIVQVYIPGFERFHLIRSGCKVAPMMAIRRDR